MTVHARLSAFENFAITSALLAGSTSAKSLSSRLSCRMQSCCLVIAYSALLNSDSSCRVSGNYGFLPFEKAVWKRESKDASLLVLNLLI